MFPKYIPLFGTMDASCLCIHPAVAEHRDEHSPQDAHTAQPAAQAEVIVQKQKSVATWALVDKAH